MKKKLLTTSAMSFLAVVAPIAGKVYAQSKNFEGTYISIGAGVMETEYQTSTNSPASLPTAGTYSSATATTAFVGFNNAATTIFQRAAATLTNKDSTSVATLSLGYNIPIDNNFLIGFDLSGRSGSGSKSVSSSYNISTITKGTGGDAGAASTTIATTTGTQSMKVQDKSSYALSIRPTYVIDKDLAVYGKLGYGLTTLEATLSTADTVSSHSIKKDVEGHTIGIGAVYLIDKNTFIDFGIDYTKNKDLKMSKDDSSVTPSLTSFSLNTTTHTLSETVDSSSYGAFIRVGMKF